MVKILTEENIVENYGRRQSWLLANSDFFCVILFALSDVVSPTSSSASTEDSEGVSTPQIKGNETGELHEIKKNTVESDLETEMESSEIKEEEDAPSAETLVVSDTLRLLDLGNHMIEFKNGVTNITLVIGMTGVGKTTVTQVLSGNNSELMSYKVKGSGFLNKDAHQRISTKTAVSRSIFPELVFDNETGSAIYDCPGFQDTRNTSVEIANTLFMKKVTDHAESIRILVIASHQSLRPGFTRSGYKDLLQNLLAFVQDVKKFNNSIAMVVTKVDVGESDEDVLEGVADFIRDVVEEFEETALADRRDEISKLTETFLQQDSSGKFTNIRIFRQPKQDGPLSDIPEVQENRERLRELVFHNSNFQYQETVPSDFGYVLSANSMLVSKDLVDKMFISTTTNLKQLQSSVIISYDQKIESIKSFDAKKNSAESDFSEFSAFHNEISSRPQLVPEFAAVIEKILNTSANTPLCKDVHQNIGYVKFLEEASNVPEERSIGSRIHQELMSVIQDLSISIGSHWRWILEIEKMADTFASGSVDHKIVTEVGKLNMVGSESLTAYDITRLELPGDMDQNHIQSNLQTGTRQKLDLLKDLLTLIAPQNQDCYYYPEKKLLIVTGHILSYSDQVLRCAKIHATTHARYVAVVATVKIYLDVDIISRSRNGGNLILIAPEVKVVGNRTISLNGQAGATVGYPAPQGESGRPGRVGGNGGNFFGAFLHVDGNLHISANGGPGGKGQDGGHGESGDDAPPVTRYDVSLSGDTQISTRFQYESVGCCRGACSKCTRFEVYGAKGEPGLPGGNGGAGGKGGYPGTITFLFEGSSKDVVISTKEGNEGESGAGGRGGQSGLAGTSLRVERIHASNYAASGSVAGGLAGAALAGSVKGAALGGPFGAILGGVLGYFVGQKAGEHWQDPGSLQISGSIRTSGSVKVAREGIPGFNRQGLEMRDISENINEVSQGALIVYQDLAEEYVEHPILCGPLSNFLVALSEAANTEEQALD